MIESLYNVPGSDEELLHFSFANADLHTRANDQIRRYLGVELPYYVLDPIPTDADFKDWLETHQDIHSRVCGILKITNNDLSNVDISNRQAWETWIWLHAQEHIQINSALGIA